MRSEVLNPLAGSEWDASPNSVRSIERVKGASSTLVLCCREESQVSLATAGWPGTESATEKKRAEKEGKRDEINTK